MPNKKKGLQDLLYDLRRIEAHREVLTENKIKAMYRQLNKDLDHFLADAYKEYADEDGRLYTSYLDQNRKKAWFLNEIVKQASGIEPELEKELLEHIEKTYSSCYKGMAQAVKSADTGRELKEISKDISVQPNVLNQAVNNNISNLTLPPVLQKHRAELIAQIQQELTIGLMNGDRYEKMAKRIAERTGVSQSKAMNITRTESHRNAESGFMDCAENIQEGLEGSDLIYAATWITMEDERVRPNVVVKTKKGWKQGKSSGGANHVILHGQTVKAGELFDLKDGAKAKAPSMSGVAAHDCNCRCEVEYNLMTIQEFAEATKQTEAQVRDKYDKPKSLEHFNDHQRKWEREKFADMAAEDKKLVESTMQSLIENNSFAMRVPADKLDSIINNGFQNQHQTGASTGSYNPAKRKAVTKKMFGSDVDNMRPSDFEKYGYLGSNDFIQDMNTSGVTGNNGKDRYGHTIIHFKKNKLKNKTTYTMDDSIFNGDKNRVIGGRVGDKCSISGMPVGYEKQVVRTFKDIDKDMLNNADEVAKQIPLNYFELQYHGKLTIDDVESVCFTKDDMPTKEIVRNLKKKGVKVYQVEGDKLNEL